MSPRPADEAGEGAALDRVTRTMALALGVGALVFVGLSAGPFLAQYGVMQPAWSWAAAIGIFAPLLAGAALSRVLRPRVLRWLAGASAVAHLLALATMLPAITTGTIPYPDGTPWLLSVTVMGGAAAAVAWRPAITWSYVVVCVVLLGVDRAIASDRPIPEVAVQDALHTLLFVSVFTALALATRRAGRNLDAAADAAVRETRASVAAEARDRERTRFEALLHDSVLVALLASVRGSERAPREARTALRLLEQAERPADDSEPVPTTAWMWRLQALTTELAPTARFSHDLADGEEPLPAEAARALLEASGEALRNSVLHAGEAQRAVHVRAASELGVEVTVLDDGAGFDPAEVDPARLGLAVGIHERMRTVPGGRAVIASRAGVGTRVSLGWSPR